METMNKAQTLLSTSVRLLAVGCLLSGSFALMNDAKAIPLATTAGGKADIATVVIATAPAPLLIAGKQLTGNEARTLGLWLKENIPADVLAKLAPQFSLTATDAARKKYSLTAASNAPNGFAWKPLQ